LNFAQNEAAIKIQRTIGRISRNYHSRLMELTEKMFVEVEKVIFEQEIHFIICEVNNLKLMLAANHLIMKKRI
jgi:hypothetical protein